MIGLAMSHTIITLWQQGKSQREIARLVHKSRDTVKTAIDRYKKNGSSEYKRQVKDNILDPHKAFIIDLLEKDLSAVRVHEELRSSGANIAYSTVKCYVAKIKAKIKVHVRFHTKAGEEAQVDFGYIGLQFDPVGRRRKAWAFNMRLSYSRLDYYEIVFDQSVKTFIELHINAFVFFGGIPKVVKIDNLKAAILEANFYEDIYQVLYKRFSEHYNFIILPCRVRNPQEKGKVESGIKFVKNNFFAGRKFTRNADMNSSLSLWVNKQNDRVHGTTKKKPQEVFTQEEKDTLLKLPNTHFIIPEIIRRKVYHDCHITVDNNYYSVPYEYVGKEIDVQQDNKLLYIYYENERVATHAKSSSRGEFITNESHYPKYKNFSPQSTEYQALYNKKMSSIGGYASQMFSKLLLEQPYQWYKSVSGILSLKKLYSDQVIELSCKRALSFGLAKYSKIKNICQSGSYNLPLEENKDVNVNTNVDEE